MAKILVSRFKSSELNPEFIEQPQSIEIAGALAQGGFGTIHSCTAIDGRKPHTPQVIKIFKDDGSGDHLRGFRTIQKLQNKIIQKNQELKQKQKTAIEDTHALSALPQFSFKGSLNKRPVYGYSANQLDLTEYVRFDELLQDEDLQKIYYPLPLRQKLQYALELVEGVQMLRDMSFIHADINGQNLFINFVKGHLSIIDYDSGAVTENPRNSPTTWGKPNEWLAPEIAQQLLNQQRGLQTVKVNLFTDMWSVTVGIHYLIFLRHPFFYLNRLGAKDVEDYFRKHRWPDADKDSSNFNKAATRTHDQIIRILENNSHLRDIKEALSVSINEGFNNASRRTPYGQWVATIQGSMLELPEFAPPVDVKLPERKQVTVELPEVNIPTPAALPPPWQPPRPAPPPLPTTTVPGNLPGQGPAAGPFGTPPLPVPPASRGFPLTGWIASFVLVFFALYLPHGTTVPENLSPSKAFQRYVRELGQRDPVNSKPPGERRQEYIAEVEKIERELKVSPPVEVDPRLDPSWAREQMLIDRMNEDILREVRRQEEIMERARMENIQREALEQQMKQYWQMPPIQPQVPYQYPPSMPVPPTQPQLPSPNSQANPG